MKKICIITAAIILFSVRCGWLSGEGESYNLKLNKITAESETNIGYPMKVKMSVSSDKKAENVPYTLLLINKSDYDAGEEDPRYIDLAMFESIDVIEKGTMDYEVEAVIPSYQGQYGDYYLVGLIDPAGDIEGDEGNLDSMEFMAEADLFDIVNLDTKYAEKTDLSISEINMTSSQDANSVNDVFVIRDTDKTTDPVITGSVTVNIMGINPQMNVPIAVYLMNGNELVPGRLWDNEIRGYVEKYVIAELLPEKPSVVHFSISLPAETRNYIRSSGTSDLKLTVVLDPDNKFDEPTIPDVLSGESNNISAADITIVYDKGGTAAGSKKSAYSKAVTEASESSTIGQWFDKDPATTGRIGAASVTFGYYILVFGGKDPGGNVLDTIEVYDIYNKTWSTLSATMISPRYGHTAVLRYSSFGNRIYIIGGRDNNDDPVDTIEVFSIYSGEVGGVYIGSHDTLRYDYGGDEVTLRYSRYGHTCVCVDDKDYYNGYFTDFSYIYIIGGVGAEKSVEYLKIIDYDGPMIPSENGLGEGPDLNQGRAFHGSEICYLRDTGDRTKEKAVIVVAGGMQNGVSTGSIEILYLQRDNENSPADGDSYFEPSASNTWQGSATKIETTLAAFSTASLKLTSDSDEQCLYIFGGERVYNKTVTTCPDSDFSNCTKTTSLITEPVSDVWSYNPFSGTLEKINTLPAGARVWSAMAEYTDPDGNNYAYLTGGSDTAGAPSESVSAFGFAAEYEQPEPAEPIITYPDERVQIDVDPDIYGGKKDLVGAGPKFMLSSKYTTTGYNFDLDSGMAVDLFNIRLWPVRTEIMAHHYVNPASDDIMEIRITLLNIPVVYYQKTGKEVALALSDVKGNIGDEQEGLSDALEEDGKEHLNWKKVNMFEVSLSLFSKDKPPEKYIGPFFGLLLVIKWDGGLKAGWDFAIGFEKGTESSDGSGSIELGLSQYGTIGTSYGEEDLIYNRAYIKPSAYGAVWGYLSAGVSVGYLLSMGIEAEFDIIRLDVSLFLANNFKFDSNDSPTRYGTVKSIGWTGKLSLVKGEANLYVEIKVPDICSEKKWGVRWYYPCLKAKKKQLPWPNVTFCAFKITLWDQEHYFGEVSDWVNYDPALTLEDETDMEIISDPYKFIYDL